MKPSKFIKVKSGATSLYVVIFATLLFTIITVGFVTLILSGLGQTVNDELSQSAYDAALAGVEDAKLAIIKCASADPTTRELCEAYLNTDVSDDPSYLGGCNTVSTILGRTVTETGVSITETVSTGSPASAETSQSYTCVTIKNRLPDYRSYLSFTDTDSLRLVPLASSGLSSAAAIRLSWYANTDNQHLTYRDLNAEGNSAVFHPLSEGVSEPPSLSVSLIQTAPTFHLESSEIDYTVGDQTDRGTLILVPSATSGYTHISNSASSHSIIGGVTAPATVTSGFLKANDKSQSNTAYVVKCDPTIGAEFVCSVIIDLPEAVGGGRNSSTGLLAVSMLYGQPSTDFAVELCKDTACTEVSYFDGAQYAIDSTGRANDVFSRVESRVELYDIYYPFPAFALQLNGSGDNLSKVFWSTPADCFYSNDGDTGTCSRTSGGFDASHNHVTSW